MGLRRLVVPVIVLALVVGAAFAMYQVANAAQNDADRQLETQVNESLTQQVGNWQRVNKSVAEFTTGFNNSTTVYNESDHELTRGEDYKWNNSDGAIKFLDTQSTSDGNNATITYDYYRNTEDVQTLAGPLQTVARAVGEVGFLGAGLALVVFLLAFAGVMAKSFADSGPRTRR